MRVSAAVSVALLLVGLGAVCAMVDLDTEEVDMRELEPLHEPDQMSVLMLLEERSRSFPTAEMREHARRVLLHEWAFLETQRHANRDSIAMTDEEEDEDAQADADVEGEADGDGDSDEQQQPQQSGAAAPVAAPVAAVAVAPADVMSLAETGNDAYSNLNPIDYPGDLKGAPRMTPACRRQLHNYLTDCVFDGKSEKANESNCLTIYAVWARDCFNGGRMPSEKEDGGDGGGGDD